MVSPVKRITKETDSQFDYDNPEGGCWWRYLEPLELDIFSNQPTDYGLTDIPEAQALPNMQGKKCQKMAPCREFAHQWEAKRVGGRYLRVPLDQLDESECGVNIYGFVLGEALVRLGTLED